MQFWTCVEQGQNETNDRRRGMQVPQEQTVKRARKSSCEIHVLILLLNNVTACSPVFLFVGHLFFNFYLGKVIKAKETNKKFIIINPIERTNQ